MEKEKIENNQSQKKKHSTRNIILAILAILLVCVVGGVGAYVFYQPKSTPTKKDDDQKVSIYQFKGNDIEDFDMSFLKLENNDKNKIYSPLSIKYALAMLQAGTKGSSKAQIDSLFDEYKFKKYTTSDHLSFANALFVSNAFKKNVKSTYIEKLKKDYYADVIFDSFDNATVVNQWIDNKTFHLIPNLIDDSTVSSLDFLLVNALAINMEWNKFIQATTSSAREDHYSVHYDHEDYYTYVPIISGSYGTLLFNQKDEVEALEFGASINKYDIVNTLGRDNIKQLISSEYQKWLQEDEYNYQYAQEENELDVDAYTEKFIQELDANYKKLDTSTDFYFYNDDSYQVFGKDLKTYDNTTLEYVAIMPKTEELSQFIQNTTAKKISELVENLKPIALDQFEDGAVTKITGKVPLFQFSYDLDLKNDLKKLGIKDVFDEKKADLSNLASDAHIEEVLHKATIDFSNEGIKAAAATIEAGMGSTSFGFEHLFKIPVIEIDITFDKPYLFLIRDKDSGEVWFVGSVYQPNVH